MQTLIIQVATTFVDDAAALVNGFGLIVTHIVMAPIDRIANACDVAGVLPARRVMNRAKNRPKTNLVWRSVGHGARRGRRGGRGCLRFLSELT
jgi:hypothetical protein